MKRDFTPYLEPQVLIANATISADNTPAAVDIVGCGSATILLDIGVGGITFSGTNKVEFKLTHSDDNSTYSDVTSADVVLTSTSDSSVGSGGIVYSLIAAHAASAIHMVGYVGGKRYLKLLADFSGTHGSGTPIGAMVIGGRGDFQGSV